MREKLKARSVFLALVFSWLQLLSFSGCSGLFYFPDRYLHFPPQRLGASPREISFQSKDGVKLYGWFFPSAAQPVRGTIIQFHGNAENMSSHYVSLLWLIHSGYNLFVFDYRGYGKSAGEPSQKGTYEDGLAALDQAWKLRDGKGSFVVYGQSLGGAIAMRSLADFPHRDETDLLVLDSTFASYRHVADWVLSRHWFTWVFAPLSYLLVSDAYSPEEALKRNQVRLLVIHDQKDPVVPFPNGQEVYELASGKKEFWTLNDGRHVGIFEADRMDGRRRFLALLNRLRK